MPTFLSDPPLAGLFTLGLAALVVGGLWVRYRKWPLLVAAAVLVLLLVAWVIAGVVLESPREESIRRVSDMAAAITAKDWPKFAENVSESFDANKMKKADLKTYLDKGMARGVRVTAWDFALTDQQRVTDTEVVIQFEGKAELPTGEPYLLHFEATFAKDPDGKFRMRSFTPFDYVQKTQKVTLP